MGQGKMGYPFIEVPTEIAEKFSTETNTRIVAIFEKNYPKHSALRRTKNGNFIITLSKGFLNDMKKELGELVNLTIEPDQSKYGMPIPEEWQAFLDQDDELRVKFEALTPGRIRGYLHYLGQPKTIDGRIKRCLDFAEKFKTGQLFGQKT